MIFRSNQSVGSTALPRDVTAFANRQNSLLAKDERLCFEVKTRLWTRRDEVQNGGEEREARTDLRARHDRSPWLA